MLGAWLPLAMVVLIGAEGRESVHAVIWFLMLRKAAPDPIAPQPQLVFNKNRILDHDYQQHSTRRHYNNPA